MTDPGKKRAMVFINGQLLRPCRFRLISEYEHPAPWGEDLRWVVIPRDICYIMEWADDWETQGYPNRRDLGWASQGTRVEVSRLRSGRYLLRITARLRCEVCGEDDLWPVCPSCQAHILDQLFGMTSGEYGPRYALLVEKVRERPDAGKWLKEEPVIDTKKVYLNEEGATVLGDGFMVHLYPRMGRLLHVEIEETRTNPLPLVDLAVLKEMLETLGDYYNKRIVTEHRAET